MRRKDREMSREFALAVMDKCEWTVVSFVTPEGEPYAVPVSAVRDGDALFFHTAKEGRKIDCIAHSPAVHVVCVGDVERAKDKFTTGYECALADGVCREVTDDAEKLHALRLIAEKYTPEHLPAFESEVAASLARTGGYAIDLTGITGKAKQLKK